MMNYKTLPRLLVLLGGKRERRKMNSPKKLCDSLPGLIITSSTRCARNSARQSPRSKWCTNQISDNVSANNQIAKLLGKPNGPCCNHHLQSQVNAMHDANRQHNAANSVHETMLSIRNSLVNSAILHRLVILRPTRVLCKPMWQAMPKSFNKFIWMCDDVEEVADNENPNIVFDSSAPFKRKVQKNAKMFNDINEICTNLQMKLCPLNFCRGDLTHYYSRSLTKNSKKTQAIGASTN
jgi:hypothetical protein